MQPDEKTLWNRRYGEGLRNFLEPDPFMVSVYDEFLAARPPGRALDVAGGAGRNALWLAQRGWRVRLVDISEAGVALARKKAAEVLSPQPTSAEPLFDAEVMDLNSAPNLGEEQYDLVLVFFFLQRRLFPALIRALKPGGLLIYRTYTTEQQGFSGGPRNPEYLLRPNELLQAFQSLHIRHYREGALEKAVTELVAQKPGIG